MSIRNELLEQILLASGGAPSLKIDRITNLEYLNNAPIVGTEYDTGYNPDPVTETTTEISVIAIISAGGETYALFSRISATAAIQNPDVRVGRTSEFTGVVGDASMAFWYDSVTSTIHVQTEFDGGGKTLVAIQVVSAYDDIAVA